MCVCVYATIKIENVPNNKQAVWMNESNSEKWSLNEKGEKCSDHIWVRNVEKINVYGDGLFYFFW